jgi:carboxylesterase type B
MKMSFIQASLSRTDVPEMSDTEGLNLNITVPKEHGENLPMLVYIHGGGFIFGSGSYPHYDQSKLVELSVVMGQPIIAVNIKYVKLSLFRYTTTSY